MERFFGGTGPMHGLDFNRFQPATTPEQQEAARAKRADIRNPNYQTDPIRKGYKLRKLLSIIGEEHGLGAEFSCYILAFRMCLPEDGIDEETAKVLAEHDKKALGAASKEGSGLYGYIPGTTDQNGYNTSLCVWESREHALAGIMHPDHTDAAKMAPIVYKDHWVERFEANRHGDGSITLTDAETGKVHIIE